MGGTGSATPAQTGKVAAFVAGRDEGNRTTRDQALALRDAQGWSREPLGVAALVGQCRHHPATHQKYFILPKVRCPRS